MSASSFNQKEVENKFSELVQQMDYSYKLQADTTPYGRQSRARGVDWARMQAQDKYGLVQRAVGVWWNNDHGECATYDAESEEGRARIERVAKQVRHKFASLRGRGGEDDFGSRCARTVRGVVRV
jgi:hypothetical protein